MSWKTPTSEMSRLCAAVYWYNLPSNSHFILGVIKYKETGTFSVSRADFLF